MKLGKSRARDASAGESTSVGGGGGGGIATNPANLGGLKRPTPCPDRVLSPSPSLFGAAIQRRAEAASN